MSDHGREAWGYVTQTFLSNELHDRFHAACKACTLPHPGVLKLLLMLDREDLRTQKQWAETLNCDASFVTDLVDTLEELDYAVRVTSTADRRRRYIGITERGEKERQRALDILAEPPAGFARLTAAESKELARLLAKACDAG